MKKMTFLILGILLATCFVEAQTLLQGRIIDGETGEAMILANLMLSQKGEYAIGVSTDFDGNYSISLDPGVYDVEATYVGYPPTKIVGLVVKKDQVNTLTIQLRGSDPYNNLGPYPIMPRREPIYFSQVPAETTPILKEQIRNNPGKDIPTILSNTPGLSFDQ